MIYLDHAATSPLRPAAREAAIAALDGAWANPSAVYPPAQAAKRLLEQSRASIAQDLGASRHEVYFTSGGTESDAWALNAAVERAWSQGVARPRIAVSAIEHHAVLETAAALERRGVEVVRVAVDGEGIVDVAALERAAEGACLVSVMFANNEVGAIQPVAACARIAHAAGALFHTDAVQAFGHVPIDVKELDVDLLSAASHKLGGPKGAGVLYVRRGVALPAFLHGGAQERGLRAGTENLPAIAGMAAASRQAQEELAAEYERLSSLRDGFIDAIKKELAGVRVNGSRQRRLPGNVNLTFEGISADSLLIRLARQGVCASAGSACAAGAREASHVLRAMGLAQTGAPNALRFTLGWSTTEDEVAQAARIVVQEVRALREIVR